jgi:hypothetical protein
VRVRVGGLARTQTASQTARQSDSQTVRQPDSQTARQPDRQSDSQTARQPDSQTARQPDSVTLQVEGRRESGEAVMVADSFGTRSHGGRTPRCSSDTAILPGTVQA